MKCESDAVHICGNIWNTQYFYFNFWTYSSYPYILIRHEKIVKPSLVNLHYSTHHTLRYFGIESSSLALKDKLIKLKSDNCGQMYFFCSLIKTPELSSPPPPIQLGLNISVKSDFYLINISRRVLLKILCMLGVGKKNSLTWSR